MSHPAVVSLAVALTGAGWHPAAWREPSARPADLLSAGYWTDLVQEAEAGLVDFVTIEDALALQSDDPFRPDARTDRVRGQLDAVLLASRIAPATSRIGLIPTAVTTHTEPFHLSKAIATLDYVSHGRGGVRVQVGLQPHVARHFGRREFPDVELAEINTPGVQRLIGDHFAEAADYVEVLRRLWDSWEDGAEIRDAARGRFVDRDKLHYIDFEGEWFSVRGPSITPRPPQGQPVVAALGHASTPYELIGRSTDVGFVTPQDSDDAARILAEVRGAQAAAGRRDETVHVFADLSVTLGETEQEAGDRVERLTEVAGAEHLTDAVTFAGTPAGLADLIQEWAAAGLTGFRLRPLTLPDDLTRITSRLVPELQRRGLFRTRYPEGDTTLRGLLGLPRPVSRYAA